MTKIEQDKRGTTAERDELLAAYRRVEPRAKELPRAALRPVTVDVIEATRTVRSTLDFARQIEAIVKRELLYFDWSPVARLEDDCAALTVAQELYTNQKTVPAVDMQKVESKAVEVRAQRLADLEPLVSRAMVSRAEVDAIRSGTGREDLLSDLRAIERSLRAAESVLGARFWVTPEQLAELSDAIRALDDALQSIRAEDESARERIESRVRMFTLLALDYDQLRRAATFILWGQEELLDKSVPSLYARPASARSSAKNEPVKPEPQSRVSALDAMPQHDLDPNGIVPQDDPYTNG